MIRLLLARLLWRLGQRFNKWADRLDERQRALRRRAERRKDLVYSLDQRAASMPQARKV